MLPTTYYVLAAWIDGTLLYLGTDGRFAHARTAAARWTEHDKDALRERYSRHVAVYQA